LEDNKFLDAKEEKQREEDTNIQGMVKGQAPVIKIQEKVTQIKVEVMVQHKW